jgi:hypothetical protein
MTLASDLSISKALKILASAFPIAAGVKLGAEAAARSAKDGCDSSEMR